jgi:hypothetical protein
MNKTRIIGIDPGPSWTGIALCTYERGLWRGEAFVLDAKRRGLLNTARDVAQLSRTATHIAVESFQQRPVGHQQFAGAETAQLIGALRYAIYADKQQVHTKAITFIQPGDPDRELPALPIGDVMAAWTTRWAAPRQAEWQHARSAWRILSRYLLSTMPDTFVRIANARTLRTLVTHESEFVGAPYFLDTDLVATSISWGTSK